MAKSFINVNDPIINVTSEQLLDYQLCPNLFYLKHLSRIPKQSNETMHSLVSRIVNSYFARLLEHKVPSLAKSKDMWDRLCEEYPRIITDKKALEGFGLIHLFDKYCNDKKLLIADYDTPYKLSFPSNVIIEGKIGAIRINDNKLELFHVETSQTTPDQRLLDMSIRYTLECYAANNLYPNYDLNYIRILHLRTGKEFITYRTKVQYDRLESIISNIGRAIRDEIFYPREDYRCSSCKYKNYCGFV